MSSFDGIARLGDHQLHGHDRGHQHDPVAYGEDGIDAGAEVSATGRLMCLHTFRAAGWVLAKIEVHAAPPPLGLVDAARVTEVSLEVPSGELVINGIDASSSDEGFGSVSVPSGWLRVRVTQHDQDSAPYDDHVGADSYTLDVWPAPAAPPQVLASASAVDWIGEVREALARDVAGSTAVGTLARRLVHGVGDASTELLALAASASAGDRIGAANLIVFAPEETARAVHQRLERDPDERVREQAALTWERRSSL